MIGTQIRGINHLYNLACDSPKGLSVYSIIGVSQVIEYLIFPTKTKNTVIAIAIDNPYFRDKGFPTNVPEIKETHKAAYDNAMKMGHKFTLITSLTNDYGIRPITLFGEPKVSRLGNFNLAIESESFCNSYDEFCKTNQKILSNVFSKYVMQPNAICKLIYMLCNGNATFFTWAIKMVMRHGVSVSSIFHLMDFNTEYGQLIKNITKGNIVALNNCTDVARAINEIFYLRAQAIAKQTINWFNTNQKKLLRNKLENNEVVHILNNFSRLSKVKRINFIRKVSTIEDVDEIIKMMSFLCTNTHFEWNKASFLDFLCNVDNLNYEIVHDKNNLIILRVHDYETVKRLGKTTNWCISKNRQYWENYMREPNNNDLHAEFREIGNDEIIHDISEKDTECDIYSERFFSLMKKSKKVEKSIKPMQFMIFDFNQLEDSLYSIIGFTASHQGVTHAHDFVNNNMMNNDRVGHGDMLQEQRRRNEINFNDLIISMWDTENSPLVKKKINSKIHSFFNEHNINISELCQYEYPRCKWDKESVKSFIDYYCNNEDYIILYEDETNLILRSYTNNMSALMTNIESYFYNNSYLEEESHYTNVGAVYHMDFSKDVTDFSKMSIWKIYENHHSRTEEASESFDETGKIHNNSINSLFEKFGLPFDTIKRPNNVDYKIFSYLKDSWKNYGQVFDLLKGYNNELSNKTKSRIIDLFATCSNGRVVNFWNMIENSEFNILKLCGENGVIRIFSILFDRLMSVGLSNTARKNDLFYNCSNVEAFKEFSERMKEEWNDYINNSLISTQKKLNKQNSLQQAHEVNGYCMILNIFIRKVIKDGWTSIYDAIIPQMINYVYDRGVIIDQSNTNLTLKKILNHFLKENFDKWNVTYNDSSYLFKMLNNCEDYNLICLSKLSAILKGDLKAKQISKLLSDLDRFCNIRNNKYHKALNMICDAAKKHHAISEKAINDIISSRASH